MSKKIRYITPKGRDERVVGEVEGTDIKIRNWNGYGVLAGHGLSTDFFDLIQARVRSNRSNMIVITGNPGEGKSYFGTRLGEIFNGAGFNPVVQIVFERDHLLRLIGSESPLKRGDVIVIDEAQYIAGARRWFEEIQKDVMEQIESVRSKGYIIIIIALHMDLLDRIIRRFVLSFMIHIEDRGRGVVYRLTNPRFESKTRYRRLGPLYLLLPNHAKCDNPDCLTGHKSLRWREDFCPYLYGDPACTTTRAIYERRKSKILGDRAKVAEMKAEDKKLRQRVYTDAEMIEALYENRDRLTWLRGRVNVGSMGLILEDVLKVAPGQGKIYRLRMRLEHAHPEMDRREK